MKFFSSKVFILRSKDPQTFICEPGRRKMLMKSSLDYQVLLGTLLFFHAGVSINITPLTQHAYPKASSFFANDSSLTYPCFVRDAFAFRLHPRPSPSKGRSSATKATLYWVISPGKKLTEWFLEEFWDIVEEGQGSWGRAREVTESPLSWSLNEGKG